MDPEQAKMCLAQSVNSSLIPGKLMLDLSRIALFLHDKGCLLSIQYSRDLLWGMNWWFMLLNMGKDEQVKSKVIRNGDKK